LSRTTLQYKGVIKSFRDKDTARIFAGRRAKKIPLDILERAEAKLAILDQTESRSELTQPPSNRLHKLSGDREGQWSISINMQWRICFEFDDETGDAYSVEITKHYD
jgi:proteic killer suppression protein